VCRTQKIKNKVLRERNVHFNKLVIKFGVTMPAGSGTQMCAFGGNKGEEKGEVKHTSKVKCARSSQTARQPKSRSFPQNDEKVLRKEAAYSSFSRRHNV